MIVGVQVSKRETLLVPHRRGEGSLPLRIGSLDQTIASPDQLRSLLHLHKYSLHSKCSCVTTMPGSLLCLHRY